MLKWWYGFDDFKVKEAYIEAMYSKQAKDKPITKVFYDTMSNFYDGVASTTTTKWEGDKEGTDITSTKIEKEKKAFISDKTSAELAEVMAEHATSQEKINFKNILFTQETQAELGKLLELFGLELVEKYVIETIHHPSIKDDYVHPEFRFIDIKKIENVLKQIDHVSIGLFYAIELIVNALGRKIDDKIFESNEYLEISKGIAGINTELKRLELRESNMMDVWRSKFISVEKWCIAEYKKSISLGFVCDIKDVKKDDGTVSPPKFFEQILDIDQERLGANFPIVYKNMIQHIDTEIQKRRDFLEKTKDKPIIFQTISRELITGILEVMENLKQDTHLAQEERDTWYKKFDAYCDKILYLNEGKIH